MEKSILEISTDNWSLSTKRGFVTLENYNTKIKDQRPFDEILSIIITGNGIVLTNNLVVRAAEEGIPIIYSNSSYIPTSISIPVVGRKDKLQKRISAQLYVSPILRKQMWKEIVKHKILSQAANLKRFKPRNTENIQILMDLAETVHSDDKTNNEAIAARIYFKSLFGSGFIRDRNCCDINIYLNYAYTVLRAAVARFSIASGLFPYIGIKHSNEYNTMPLVDDLMEPFRGIADEYVYSLWLNQGKKQCFELSTQNKRFIVRELFCPVKNSCGLTDLTTAIKTYALSISQSFVNNSVQIDFPESQHPDLIIKE